MKIQEIKITPFILSAIFVTALLGLFSSGLASAQILKPGELIYSRAATAVGGNCDTAQIWVVGLDGSNDRFITQGLHPRISPDGKVFYVADMKAEGVFIIDAETGAVG